MKKGVFGATDGVSTLGSKFTETREKIIQNIKQGGLQANKRIAGIPCPNVESSKEMLGIFTTENIKINKLKEKLNSENLPFRAIIETSLFTKIKKEKSVYTFKNIDEYGGAKIDNASVDNFLNKEVVTFEKTKKIVVGIIQAIAIIGLVVLSQYLLWSFTTNNYSTLGDFWAKFIALDLVLVSWITVIICAMVGLALEWGIEEGIFNRKSLYKRVEKRISQKSYQIFWPDHHDDFKIGTKIEINFIDPDKTSKVKTRVSLWKEAGYTVHISAQKEAFSLNIGSAKYAIQNTLNKIIEANNEKRELEIKAKLEARRLYWQKYDPIVSVEIDEFTILIDAYGGKSFVSEREVVDCVTNYYNDKLKQFQTSLN